MAERISINLTQDENGFYGATVTEFPDVSVVGASTLDELRRGLEHVLSNATERRIRLPEIVPGSVTSLGVKESTDADFPTIVLDDKV